MEPFLKWAGGKRWLTTRPIDIFPDHVETKRYFEPFLGGAAVFFHLQPTGGYLSDLNVDLINAYTTIRDNWEDLVDVLFKYDKKHSVDFYYEMREKKPRVSLLQAARFIYLNRTCWNGLYRVNKNGQFNVPIGTKTKVLSTEDNFQELSLLLNTMSIESCDFQNTIDKARSGDFVFIDPPYTVKHNLNGFVKYNEKIFSWQDQIRLKDSVSKAIKRGAFVLILNANHISIKELYKGVGKTIELERASVIAGNSSARGRYTELAIKCW
ncbi:MAG: Dam family site-specific DNA-(adenine-N6)-methyltransferase [Bacteroidota bacterium]|nr:Dam family site-specific DNA-(adenine-N6)-methyltransferase [Bacteroidota bacterium]